MGLHCARIYAAAVASSFVAAMLTVALLENRRIPDDDRAVSMLATESQEDRAPLQRVVPPAASKSSPRDRDHPSDNDREDVLTSGRLELWGRRGNGVPLYEQYRRVPGGLAGHAPARPEEQLWIVHRPEQGARQARRWSPHVSSAPRLRLGSPIRFTVLEGSSDRPTSVGPLVVDDRGRPLGTVGDGACRLVTPFVGLILLPECTPAPVQIPRGTTAVTVHAKPRAFATGRIVGPQKPGDLLVFVPPGPSCLGSSTLAADEGTFELGPVPPGAWMLTVSSRRGRRPDTTVRVRLREGTQHLGEIRLEEYGRIEIRLPAMELPDDGRLFASIFAQDAYADKRRPFARRLHGRKRVVKVESHAHAMVVIDRVAQGTWAGWLWSRDGKWGEFAGALCPGGDTVTGRLSPPGRIEVDIYPSSDLGNSRVIAYDRTYTESPVEVARHGAVSSGVRVRAVAVRGSRVIVDAMWPLEARVALVSQEGVELAAAECLVGSGTTHHVRLSLSGRLGSLMITGQGLCETRRIAILQRDRRIRLRATVEPDRDREFKLLPAGPWEILNVDGQVGHSTERWCVVVEPGRVARLGLASDGLRDKR